MKKDFVYFFKHNNINAIKIGKTSGESVLDRFNSFRTYAPFGAEIIGFFETDDGHRDERELHKLFKDHRLQGEFFDISLDIVKKLRGVQYNKKGNNIKEIGVIAEEINEILPQVVSMDLNGNPASVSYGRLTALLIEAIKELDNKINKLK